VGSTDRGREFSHHHVQNGSGTTHSPSLLINPNQWTLWALFPEIKYTMCEASPLFPLYMFTAKGQIYLYLKTDHIIMSL